MYFRYISSKTSLTQTSIENLNCFGVSVTGPGILSHPVPNACADGTLPGFAGILAGTATTANGGYVDVTVPVRVNITW